MSLRVVSFSLFILLLFSECTPNANHFDSFIYGKIRKTITVENEGREYVLHVPKSYIGSKALPVVILLHGSGSTGDEFYQNSGWWPLLDKEDVFGIFPTAKSYCTYDVGIQYNTTTWNSLPAGTFTTCAGTVLTNDITFLTEVIQKMNIEYNIDKKRIYVVGFANGAQMAAKVSMVMDDQIAAIVQFAGSFTHESNWSPKRNIPVLFQVGNEDNLFFSSNHSMLLSQFGDEMEDKNSPLFPVTTSYVKSFGLQSHYVMSGDTTSQVTATYSDFSNIPVLEMSLIRGIGHIYPVVSNGFNSAEQHWNWLKKYTLN